jgi:hypothetical protein
MRTVFAVLSMLLLGFAIAGCAAPADYCACDGSAVNVADARIV